MKLYRPLAFHNAAISRPMWIAITAAIFVLSGCIWSGRDLPRGYGWVLRGNGDAGIIFVVPTIHHGNDLTKRLPLWLTSAIEKAEVIAVEIDPWSGDFEERVKKCGVRASIAMQQAIDARSARRLVDFAESRSVTRRGDWSGLTYAQATEVISSLAMAAAGLSTERAIDTVAMNRVDRTRQKVVELESLCTVLRTLVGSAPKTDSRLGDLLTDLENDLFAKYMNAAITSWAEGDERILASTLFTLRTQSTGFNAVFAESVESRNESIANAILALGREHKLAVALVGAGHFVGDKSIDHYLRRAGASLERVSYRDSK